MRTTLDLDEDILEIAKEMARRQGKTAGKMVSELVRKSLEPAPFAHEVRNGVPVLYRRVPESGMITMDLVNRLRDEE